MNSPSKHPEETGSQKILRFQSENLKEINSSEILGGLTISSNEKDDQIKPETVLKNEVRNQGALLGILTALQEQQLVLAGMASTSTGKPDQISQTEELMKNKLHDQIALLENLSTLHRRLLVLAPGKLLESE
ncbi:MAG: hypothetical protein QM496_11540 [Verrucomicrobiota bacterium]